MSEKDVKKYYADYVLMCKSAFEIQAIWEPTVGDIFHNTSFHYDDIHIITTEEQAMSLCLMGYTRLYSTWIPHLNQLLDMYAGRFDMIFDYEVLRDLYDFIDENLTKNHAFGLLYKTKEQLALLFVMEKVFEKKLIDKRLFGTKQLISAEWIKI